MLVRATVPKLGAEPQEVSAGSARRLLLGTPLRASVFPICAMEPRTPEPSSTQSPTGLLSSGQGETIFLMLCWHFPTGPGLEQPPLH